MNKRYELATGLLCAMAFALSYLSPVYPAAIFIAALIAKFDIKVRKTAAEAFVLSFLTYIVKLFLDKILSAFAYLIGLIPVDFLGEVSHFIRESNSVINDLISFLFLLLVVIFVLLFLLGKSVKTPIVSSIVGKFINEAED